MNPFETAGQQERLLTVALSWIGTPFRPHAGIKGAGADCMHVALLVYWESGHLFQFEAPPYTIDGGNHLKTSKFKDWLDQSSAFAKAEAPTQIGDCLLFKVGGVEHHVGIQITASTFIHSMRHHGVIQSNLKDSTWTRRLTAIYRPVSP